MQHSHAEQLLALLDLSGDETVLDAGCGSGRVTELLLERLPRGRVIAVDASERMVAHARDALGDRATVLHMDLTELDLDERVDAAFSNAVFHWVLDQERLYQRLHAVLRPGGRLIANCGAVGNLERFFAIAAEVAAEQPYESHLRDFEPGWRFLDPEETEERLRRAGFSEARVTVLTREEVPPDPAGYVRTAPLLCYLEMLPAELHDPFVDEVINRCGSPLRIDQVRLQIEARR